MLQCALLMAPIALAEEAPEVALLEFLASWGVEDGVWFDEALDQAAASPEDPRATNNGSRAVVERERTETDEDETN